MRPSESDILESAITLVEAALALNIMDRHKRDVINMAIWKITEARGKYTTRFRSTSACSGPKGTKLQHDHVIPRKELINAIMKEPSRARELLGTAVACTVTVEEHRRLTTITKQQPDLKAWERYTAAGVTWRDTDEDSANGPVW